MLKIISKKNKAAEIICNLNKIDNKQLKEIKSTLDKYGMIYFPKQKLSSKNYLNFAKKFGKPANYPRLKGLNKKYPQITVVQRKSTDKGPSFGEQFHTDSSYTKKPPRYTMLLSKLVPKKGVANTDFSSQYLAYEKLSKTYKNKLKKLKKELGDILNLFEELNLADTNSVEAMSHPLDLSQPTRIDLVTEKDMREELQKNAPSVQSGLFLVPKVIEGED